jgi:SAM-dependent methyltransferase
LRVDAGGRPCVEKERPTCPFCGQKTDGCLRAHIRDAHGEEALHRAILADKEQGLSNREIGVRYGIRYSALQKILTEAYGANVDGVKTRKRVRRWEPPGFHAETATVWSYRQRGDWATHDGLYRGNWSPYIPRNVILKYSDPGDIVLDYFVGGGTTAVEAKLLGRQCIARDINPDAVRLTEENLAFTPPSRLFGPEALPVYEPEVSVGDATDLSDIPEGRVDLICAHPPYAGIIKYSTGIPGDLSDLSLGAFLERMDKVARESVRVLKPGGKCAILIGDGREAKHVVPMGFRTIRVFLEVGFRLKELVIKRQHKCKSTGFWYKRSIEHNFLLLAHEYLPIFEKPCGENLRPSIEGPAKTRQYAVTAGRVDQLSPIDGAELETTSVWILPSKSADGEIRRNLVRRFAAPSSEFVEVLVDGSGTARRIDAVANPSVVYVPWPRNLSSEHALAGYLTAVKAIAEEAARSLPSGGFLVVGAQDSRTKRGLVPMAIPLYEELLGDARFAIKEIVVVVPEGVPQPAQRDGDALDIIHRYLLVYRFNGSRDPIGET